MSNYKMRPRRQNSGVFDRKGQRGQPPGGWPNNADDGPVAVKVISTAANHVFLAPDDAEIFIVDCGTNDEDATVMLPPLTPGAGFHPGATMDIQMLVPDGVPGNQLTILPQPGDEINDNPAPVPNVISEPNMSLRFTRYEKGTSNSWHTLCCYPAPYEPIT